MPCWCGWLKVCVVLAVQGSLVWVFCLTTCCIGREAAEKAVAELDRREVQGSLVRANFWRRRASKKDKEAAAAA